MWEAYKEFVVSQSEQRRGERQLHELRASVELEFTVYSLQGAKVQVVPFRQFDKSGANQVRLDTKKLPSGTYMLLGRRATGELKVFHRFTKE